jgi:hypothetical protein
MESSLHRAVPWIGDRVSLSTIKIMAHKFGKLRGWCQLIAVNAMVASSVSSQINGFHSPYHPSFYLALRQTLADSHLELHANSPTEK